MPSFSSTPFAFPEFRGATRRLVLWNLSSYFVLLIAQLAFPIWSGGAVYILGFAPDVFLHHGYLWQPFTYSLVQYGILSTLLSLLMLWFIAGFLEMYHSATWVMGLYIAAVLGTAAAATVIYACAQGLGFSAEAVPLTGCFGGIFGLLAVIGVLHGDVQFMLFPLPIGIKARYLAAILALISFAMLFGQQRMSAFAELGGGLTALAYISLAPRRGLSLGLSEQWYGLRNGYYRWKRRRAGRKFEVYMRSQGRTVRFDSKGRPIDDDPNDKSRWN
jgi:membrane associated rhomboid family serine protease